MVLNSNSILFPWVASNRPCPLIPLRNRSGLTKVIKKKKWTYQQTEINYFLIIRAGAWLMQYNDRKFWTCCYCKRYSYDLLSEKLYFPEFDAYKLHIACKLLKGLFCISDNDLSSNVCIINGCHKSLWLEIQLGWRHIPNDG